MVKIVFKNGLEIMVNVAKKAIIPQDYENLDIDTDTDDDSFCLRDVDDNLVFCGKWSEILYVLLDR